MSRKRKQKKPAMILRLAWRLGYRPGRVMSEVLEWIEVLAVAGALAAVIMSFVTVRMHVPRGHHRLPAYRTGPRQGSGEGLARRPGGGPGR